MKLSKLLAIGLLGALGLLAGFGLTQPGEVDLGVMRGTDWDEISGPVDYSQSRDRFVLDIAELQLFGKSKAPVMPLTNPGGGAQTEDPKAQQPRLLGIAILDGAKVALLAEPGTAPVRVSRGDTLGSGWQVKDIDMNFVTMSYEDGDTVLNLYKPGAGQTPNE
jgi:hypothetical protein